SAPIGAGGPPMGAGGSAITLGPQGGPTAPIGTGGSGNPPASGGDTQGGNYTNKPTYLTVNPELKRLLDAMEVPKEPRSPVLVSAGAIDLESANGKITDTIRAASGLGASLPLPVII